MNNLKKIKCFNYNDKLKPTLFYSPNWEPCFELNPAVFYIDTTKSYDWWELYKVKSHVPARVCGWRVYRKIDKYGVKHYTVWIKSWGGITYKLNFSSKVGKINNKVLIGIKNIESSNWENSFSIILMFSDLELKFQFENSNYQTLFFNCMYQIFNEIHFNTY